MIVSPLICNMYFPVATSEKSIVVVPVTIDFVAITLPERSTNFTEDAPSVFSIVNFPLDGLKKGGLDEAKKRF